MGGVTLNGAVNVTKSAEQSEADLTGWPGRVVRICSGEVVDLNTHPVLLAIASFQVEHPIDRK